ncbi:hypothetical protein [Pseudoxanthomonas kalamensis]|uniref:hypothetical protein n=1 Tax=Pseudoxanthomonas kalamensis TaxID=289483 RepID=UPI0013918D59|nr:hypothetical protein [Pseudoxanthomonas kalamensis]
MYIFKYTNPFHSNLRLLHKYVFGVIIFSISILSFAQTPSYGVHEKAIERLSEARTVAPIKVDGMFGDRLSLYNGSVEFNAVDISIPGNSSLPVELRRNFSVVDRRETTSVTWFDHFGGFSEWDLDIPYLSGTFAASTGWQVSGSSPNSRCSVTNAPPSQTYFASYQYWNGYQLHLPGQGDRTMLKKVSDSPLPSPTSGGPYPWITKDFWQIGCKSSTSNGYPGEAFIAVSPNGVKYTLDHVISITNSSSKTYTGSVQRVLSRVSVYFVATKIEDRYGNWVSFSWSGNRLTGIASNDGRQITISYDSSNRIVSAASSIGVWTYGYLNGRLSSVTFPDGSKWTYAATGKLNIMGAEGLPFDDFDNNCPENLDGVGGVFAYTVTHPSGAQGYFSFVGMRHHRSNTPKYCEKPSSQYEYLLIPNYSDNFTLVSKTVSGPGVSNLTWSYSYGDGAPDTFANDCTFPGPLCPQTKFQIVNGPDGKWERYEYGIVYGVNEGQLLKSEVGAGPSNILEIRSNTYISNSSASAQVFPERIGNEVRSYADSFASSKLRPVLNARTNIQGMDLMWSVDSCGAQYCFDVFSRPTKITKSSSPSP